MFPVGYSSQTGPMAEFAQGGGGGGQPRIKTQVGEVSSKSTGSRNLGTYWPHLSIDVVTDQLRQIIWLEVSHQQTRASTVMHQIPCSKKTHSSAGTRNEFNSPAKRYKLAACRAPWVRGGEVSYTPKSSVSSSVVDSESERISMTS